MRGTAGGCAAWLGDEAGEVTGGAGMAGSGHRGLSRGALIRQRAKARFVGRRAQLALFT